MDPYQAIYEFSADAILFTRPDGGIDSANPAACRLFGRSEKEIVALGRGGVIDITDPRLAPALEERRRTGQFKGELRFRRKDGSVFTGEISTAIFQDPSGQARTSMIIRDVTDKNEIHENLRVSAEKLKNLFDILPVGVSILNAEGQIVDINPALEKILGITREGLMQGAYRGRRYLREDLSELLPSDFPSERAAREGRPVFNAEMGVQKENGEIVWVSVNAAPLPFGGKSAVLVTNDITDMRRTRDELGRVHSLVENNLKTKQREIAQAQKTLFQMIPGVLPSSREFWTEAAFAPSEELGGDFFLVQRQDGMAALILADCCGHGIAASLNAAILRTICDKFVPDLFSTMSPRAFLSAVNREIRAYTSEGQYHALFAALYTEDKGSLVYASAGGRSPVLMRGGDAALAPVARGLPLGYEMATDYEEIRLEIRPGERILFYSDALVEVMDAEENDFAFRENDLLALLTGKGHWPASGLIELILETLRRTHGKLPLRDDLSLIVLHRLAPLVGRFEAVRSEEIFKISRKVLFGVLGERDWVEDDITELEIAFREMVLNAVAHGNQGDPGKKVFVEYRVDAEAAELLVRDEGPGFAFETLPDPTDVSRARGIMDRGESEKLSHGRGIWMSRNRYLNKLEFLGSGNEVRLLKKKRAAKTRMLGGDGFT